MFAVASKVTTAVAPRAASGSSSALAGRARATPALPLAPALRSRASSSPRARTTASASNEDLMEQLMAMLGGAKGKLVAESDALPGRQEEMRVTDEHFVLGNPIRGPFPDHLETCVFATGCFWGTEKMFWRVPGVYSTSVGYVGGYTQNPTYEETCSGMTGHTEAVQVAGPERRLLRGPPRHALDVPDPTRASWGDSDACDRASTAAPPHSRRRRTRSHAPSR